jgi:biopolymer transport protein ExbD
MKIAGRHTYMTALESVVMTDIILNMFIFFFISFSLLYTFNPHRIQKLDIKLPKAASASMIEEQEQVNISISNENLIFVEADLVTFKELKRLMAKKKEQNPEVIVILRADRLVGFEQVVKVLDALTEVGVTNLNIAAVKE